MANSLLINPFRDLERLLTDTTRTPGTIGMPMDVFRDGENYVVKIDLAGADPETIDVDVEDRTLTVRAERKAERTHEGFEWLVRERAVGSVARQLTLGNNLAIDRIEADYSDGILRLTIPVAEEAKPRKISVNRGGSSTQIDAS